MKISHVLYKVDDLDKAVNQFRHDGFHIEHGSKSNPHNALIYFSEGPYIELLQKTPVSGFAKAMLKLIGKGKVVDRLNRWENEKEGFIDLCLEVDGTNFKREEDILKKYGQKYFITKSKRLDPYNRLLKWKLLFPYELRMPFLMTPFNIDPKPKNFVHPNGFKKIKRISFGTMEAMIPLVAELCNDDTLDLFIGSGVSNVIGLGKEGNSPIFTTVNTDIDSVI